MGLKFNNYTSLNYHNIFDYKLTKEELLRWQYKQSLPSYEGKNQRKGKKQLQREKYSQKKLIIAKRAAKSISKIPTVKFIGITGALAMNNASNNSDIDLMIIAKSGRLWTTRILVYLFTCLFGFKTRKPKSNLEKDRLCLNIWMDESDLVWDKKDRNLYTAHEIAQIIPLINKDDTYEKFLYLNRWILNFWPYAVGIKLYDIEIIQNKAYSLWRFLEKLSFNLQYFYMKNKITREVITKTRAIFHPNDWSKTVLSKLSS